MTKQEKAEYDRKRYAEKRYEILARSRAYMATDEYKKAKSEYDKAYRVDKKDDIDARKKKWAQENPDKIKASRLRSRYNENGDPIRRGTRYTRKVHSETFQTYRQLFIARRKAVEGSHTAKDFQDIVLDQAGICNICYEEKTLCKDHIIPIIRGGSNDKSNLQGLCSKCNSRKAHMLMEELEQYDALVKHAISSKASKE